MSYMKVSASGMLNDEETITAQSKGIPDFLQELRESMILLSSCWEGPTWDEFQQQVIKDIENMNDVYNWLTTYIEVLSITRNTYQKAEKTGFQAIEEVKM